MKNKNLILLCLGILFAEMGLLGIIGCATDKSISPKLAPVASIKKQPLSSPENPPKTGESVTLTPYSGRFGYNLKGAWGFNGDLIKDSIESPKWQLSGKFGFNTGGYHVSEPVVTIAESYPEQVTVTIKVTPPPPGAMVTQVITFTPVTAEIKVSNEAQFNIRIITE